MFKITCLFLFLCFLLTGCEKTYREPLTRDNLNGKKIGVMIGYSTDYILSGSDYDLDIYRYDMEADMQLALRFNRIDAVALERDEAGVFCRIEPEYEIGLTVEEQIEYAYMFNSDRQKLLGQFNRFIYDFKETKEYADILRRAGASAEAPYQPKEVKNTVTTDQVLKVAAFDGWEPISYINTTTGAWEGYDVEVVSHFANSIGAKLELVDMSWNQMLIEIALGSVDLILCPDSLLMAKDLEMKGNITLSDPVFLKDIVLVVNKEEK
ncbi:MAG: substrate-binding periplasmic protein [Syntrophomonadaceae bacterium]